MATWRSAEELLRLVADQEAEELARLAQHRRLASAPADSADAKDARRQRKRRVRLAWERKLLLGSRPDQRGAQERPTEDVETAGRL